MDKGQIKCRAYTIFINYVVSIFNWRAFYYITWDFDKGYILLCVQIWSCHNVRNIFISIMYQVFFLRFPTLTNSMVLLLKKTTAQLWNSPHPFSPSLFLQFPQCTVQVERVPLANQRSPSFWHGVSLHARQMFPSGSIFFSSAIISAQGIRPYK